ncbi:MAG: hypothetical protein ACYDBJ_07025 [Aggregatilineales bacterium]
MVVLVLALLVVSPALAQQATPAPTMPATQSATQAVMGPTVGLGSSKDFSKILVGPNGMTLYVFTPDPLNQSTCEGQCAKAWPPLTVTSADQLTVADGIPGKFGTFARKDGTLQVTYNGLPLYYWFKDKQVGDTTGHRIGRTWWVVPPATAYIYHDPKLGSILVGQNGMTVYTFAKDTPGVSNCTDKCATAWPPLTVKTADALVPGVNLPGKFDTLKRADGSLQVTYNGMPLYYFSQDNAIGDTTGEAVAKVWYTVVPETMTTSNTSALGDFLVTYDGMTLYAFAKDTPGVDTCTGDCAKNWPAFTVGSADRLAAGTSLKGKLDTIKLDDGSLQVTYNGQPLYFFKNDHVPGDTNGQGVGKVWAVVKP